MLVAFCSSKLTFLTSDNLVTSSAAIADIPGLANLLGVGKIKYSRWPFRHSNVSAVLAWGRKPSATKAEQLAKTFRLPLLRLEDGFLRSVGLGSETAPLSIVVDDVGIYYDAAAPSRLEQLISETLSAAQLQRAREIILLWQQFQLSKYNHSADYNVLPNTAPYVLVVDQTFGDAAIGFGQANAHSFQQMLEAAIAQYPQHQILVKIHPDVFAGKKKGHFSNLTAKTLARITLLPDDVHPANLLKHATAVYCVTSQMGFEALLWQKPVYTFGMPFYGGWGLTIDTQPAPTRRKKVALEQLVHAALVEYPRYLDPETGERCEIEQLMAWLALQRQNRSRFSQALYLFSPPRWKKNAFKRFFQGAKLNFLNRNQAIPVDACQVVWGAKDGDNLVRVEDGFIRSVGLGADLTQPASWVLDEVGMYYDARSPSGLEQLLASHNFTDIERQRAMDLVKRLLALKVTKYNVGNANWQRPQATQVILVPGQVESDASIRFGSPVLKTNLQLLQAVREAEPTAYIVYKPHPDVQAGLRQAGTADAGAASHYCDEIIGNEDMAHLLNQVDAVHTLTSLTGFEALLRAVSVVCYGQPFYSGWGLTQDRYPPLRRQRKLQLSELVAATLLLYPTYISAVTGAFTTPERIVTELEQQRMHYHGPGLLRLLMRQLQRFWRY
jgi:capsular polysaccharide export protein